MNDRVAAIEDVSYRIEIRAPDGRWQLWSTPDSKHGEQTFRSVRDSLPHQEFRLIRTVEREEIIDV